MRDHAPVQSCRAAGGLGSSSRPTKGCLRWQRATLRFMDTMFCPGAVATDDWGQTRSLTRFRPAVIRWWRTFRRRSRPRERSGSTATRRKTVPDGWILDADGNATNDPNAFYGPPRGGILPLGGAAGHKGFALGLLVEILGSALARIQLSRPASVREWRLLHRRGPLRVLPARMSSDDSWTKPWPTSSRRGPRRGLTRSWFRVNSNSARSGNDRVDGIPVDAATLEAMREHGARLGVDVDGLLNPEGEE